MTRPTEENAPLGIAVIDKPIGLTSHDVVGRLRRLLGTRRIGHAGTLDPLATGVLVVAVGPATRFLQYLPLEPKRYVARVRFGQSTASYDAEGEVTSEGLVPPDLRGAVEAVMPDFLGLQDQIPPMYSAVKVKGRPLYDYARKGEEIERRSRTIHIGRLEILSSTEEEIELFVECSGGTYIRTLGHDLGIRLGSGAHLSGLRRTGVGRFGLEHAIPLEEATREGLVTLRDGLSHLPVLALSEEETVRARHGADLTLAVPSESRLLLLTDPHDAILGVARVVEDSNGTRAHPECVIPSEVQI